MRRVSIALAGAVLLACFAGAAPMAYAAQPAGAVPAGASAVISAVTGGSQWATSDGLGWRTAQVGDVLPWGTLVCTGPGAELVVALGTGRQVRLAPDSVLALPATGSPALVAAPIRLFLGRMSVDHGPDHRGAERPERFTVKTPAAEIGAADSLFSVAVEPDGVTATAVQRGSVEVTSGGRTVALADGEELRSAVDGDLGETDPSAAAEQPEDQPAEEDGAADQTEATERGNASATGGASD